MKKIIMIVCAIFAGITLEAASVEWNAVNPPDITPEVYGSVVYATDLPERVESGSCACQSEGKVCPCMILVDELKAEVAKYKALEEAKKKRVEAIKKSKGESAAERAKRAAQSGETLTGVQKVRKNAQKHSKIKAGGSK